MNEIYVKWNIIVSRIFYSEILPKVFKNKKKVKIYDKILFINKNVHRKWTKACKCKGTFVDKYIE